MGRAEGPSLIGPGPEWAGRKGGNGEVQDPSGRGRGAITDRSRTRVGGAEEPSLIGPGPEWAGQKGVHV